MERSSRNLARHGCRRGLRRRRNKTTNGPLEATRVEKFNGEGDGEDFQSENGGWGGEMKREKGGKERERE